MLYGIELNFFLQNNIKISEKTIEIESIDKLPKKIQKKPLFLIANESPSCCPVSHWVSLYYDGDKAIYFDSFGRKPCEELKSFFKKHNIRILEINHNQYQKLSSEKCGMFCCIFLVLCSRGLNLQQIQSKFSIYNHELNDYIVANMYENKVENKFRN